MGINFRPIRARARASHLLCRTVNLPAYCRAHYILTSRVRIMAHPIKTNRRNVWERKLSTRQLAFAVMSYFAERMKGRYITLQASVSGVRAEPIFV
jgi:hypothetical protein